MNEKRISQTAKRTANTIKEGTDTMTIETKTESPEMTVRGTEGEIVNRTDPESTQETDTEMMTEKIREETEEPGVKRRRGTVILVETMTVIIVVIEIMTINVIVIMIESTITKGTIVMAKGTRQMTQESPMKGLAMLIKRGLMRRLQVTKLIKMRNLPKVNMLVVPQKRPKMKQLRDIWREGWRDRECSQWLNLILISLVNTEYRQLCLIRTDVDPKYLSGLGKNPYYAYRNYMYRKGLGPSNLSGLDENQD